MMKLHDLKPAAGAKHRAKRVGRGIGGKGGKTAGRGTKGQFARNTVHPGFEGGQTPLHRRTPKAKGFKNPFRVEYNVINLDTLDAFAARTDTTTYEQYALAGAAYLEAQITASGSVNVRVSQVSTCTYFAGGSGGPVALHAAVLSDYFSAVTLDGALVSWDSVARTPLAHDQLASVVPGALKVYDLPDLAAAIAPRPLTVRNPVDATGKPLSKDAAEQAYKPVRDAYQKAGAADKFKLVVDTR